MSPRPAAKLAFSATFVVWASHALTLGEKVVWYHSWAMDQGGPDACYMSDGALAERLGLEERTVQQLRYRLRKLGLLVAFQRVEGKQAGWVALLPSECRPSSPRAAGAEAFERAKHLDACVLMKDPSRNPHCKRTATTIATAAPPEAAALASRAASPTSVVESEAPLRPAVRRKEGGEGAKAPDARKEDEQLRFARLTLAVLPGGEVDQQPGFAEFLRAKAEARLPQHGREETA